MAISASIVPADVLAAARGVADGIVELRREIHANPELGLDNPATQSLVLRELERIGIDNPKLGRKCSSITAEIRGLASEKPATKASGKAPKKVKTVALRADMDALPLTEHTKVA